MPSYNPNDVGVRGSLFGLPFSVETANVIIVPVPWEVTVSYGAGTAQGPRAVLNASPQLDLFYPGVTDPWNAGIAMHDMPSYLEELNKELRSLVGPYIKRLEEGVALNSEDLNLIQEVNKGCLRMNHWVSSITQELLTAGKFVGLLGGDHSSPLGFLEILAQRHENFGVLQIDAHCDLRDSYEGFKYSHASIMHNAMDLGQISKLVQVGIRDFCDEEFEYIKASDQRVCLFTDEDLKRRVFEGDTWKNICGEIIDQLPSQVYISFDIDGLDPGLCPNTGTPVPGGLSFGQAIFLIQELVRAEKRIVGFDLCEVAGEEWDANVGARVLYHLCVQSAVSNRLLGNRL